MAGDTATIRVSRETRDMLARQARARGVSLSSLLADIAHRRDAEALLQSERAAGLEDASSSDVAAEEELWGTVSGDGLG